MKQAARVAGVVFLLLALGACVAGSAESQHAASGGAIGQFFLGLWHGIIAPVMLVVEVINALLPKLLPWQVHFYETHGTGVIYDVGFYLGLIGSPLLAGSRVSRRG